MSLMIGILAGFAGLFVLRMAWSDTGFARWGVGAGWGLIAVAILAWAIHGGWDRGTAMGVLAICIQALFFIAHAAWSDRGERRAERPPRRRVAPRTPWVRYPLRVVKFLWLAPVSGAVSLATAVGLHEGLLAAGWHPADALIVELMAFPMIWAGLASHVLIARRYWSPAAVSAGLAALSYLIISPAM